MKLDERFKKWKRWFIYRYLNSVGDEIDSRPYPSWVLARHFQLRKQGWGAITCEPFEVPKDHDFFRG